MGREFLFLLLFVALTILNTWPLVMNLGAAVSDPGDPYLNSWILHWDWWATFHRPLSLYHMPMFHPSPYALAFSENLYGIALLLFPFYAIGFEPLTVYGLATILGFALSGYGGFVLARLVTGSELAAVCAGIFYAFVPFRFDHLPHLQFTWGAWVPLLLAALLWHLRRPSWQRATAFGVAFLMNGLTNIHCLVFGSFSIFLSVLFLLLTDARPRDRRFWLPLGTATLVASMALLPFLLPYDRVSKLYRFERNRPEALGGSARASDWWIAGKPNKTYGNLANVQRAAGERLLFPGVLSILFALSALLLLRDSDLPRSEERGERSDAPPAPRSSLLAPRFRLRLPPVRLAPLSPRMLLPIDALIVLFAILAYYRSADDKVGWPDFGSWAVVLLLVRWSIRLPEAWGGSSGRSLLTLAGALARKLRPDPARWRFPAGIRLALLWVLIGFLGSRGLRTFFYEFLFENIRIFRSIRVPARFAIIVYVGLTVLIAAGILPLLRRFGITGRRVVAAIIAVAFLAELRAAPIRWHLALPETPPVYRWLATAPFSGAVLELPIQYWEDMNYVLRATAHRRPLINGVSGFFPPTHEMVVTKFNANPVDATVLDDLERLRCSLIIVHNCRMRTPAELRQWLKDGIALGSLTFIRRFDHLAGGDYVFAMTSTEPQAAARLRPPETPDPSGLTPRQNAERFLDGRYHRYNSSTFGWLDSPTHQSDVYGKFRVSGWALSPHGVKAVNLRFENGRVVIPAELWAWKEVADIYPWYPGDGGPGYYRDFMERPPGVSVETDLQVEIVDGSGERTRLEHVWFRWIPRRTIRFERWDDNALDGLLARLGVDSRLERRRVVEDRSVIQQLAYAWAGRLAEKSDEEFLDAAYQTFLMRSIDPAGRQMYLDQMARGDSRQDILDAILHSQEFSDLYRERG